MNNVNFSRNPNSVFVKVSKPESRFKELDEKPKYDANEQDARAIKRARRASFAIVNQISRQMDAVNVSIIDFWNYIKHSYDVGSRKELNERQWVVIEARLRAASTSSKLFRVLMDEVKDWRDNHAKQQRGTRESEEVSTEATRTTTTTPKF